MRAYRVILPCQLLVFIMSDLIRSNVDSILSNAGIKFDAVCLGQNQDDNKWQCFEWKCKLSKLDPALYINGHQKATKSESFDFRMGIGYCKKDRFGRTIPTAPHAADVLCSLILDSLACNVSFNEWCDMFGYDTDSRKALETYLLCQQNTEKMRNVINAETIKALEIALQDY